MSRLPRPNYAACFASLTAMFTLCGGAYAQTKAIEFSDMGTAITGARVKMPESAALVRQISAPLGDKGETLLLNFYKLNGVVFLDCLTAREGQPWTRRNHVRLRSPLPIRPEKMAVQMQFMEPTRQRGFLLIASDEAGHLTMALPKGFGGPVMQQEFLGNSSTSIRRTYDFGQLDSRGFVSVKASVESAGQIKPTEDVQYFIWNGKRFVPRRPN